MRFGDLQVDAPPFPLELGVEVLAAGHPTTVVSSVVTRAAKDAVDVAAAAGHGGGSAARLAEFLGRGPSAVG
ncbi:hypothetical protein [Nonomuraea longicatena]|uniref:Uncharacterized protein n=1 Tax=Nonomuraea longicatena TaxID=83682 RepID=A0ABP4BK23_9ACTN